MAESQIIQMRELIKKYCSFIDMDLLGIPKNFVEIADWYKGISDNVLDLEELKDFLLGKIDELAIACNKKFADKNENSSNK